MNKAIATSVFSLANSAMLFSGVQALQTTAFTISLILIGLCVIALIFGIGLDASQQEELKEGFAHKFSLSVLSWVALIYAGHPVLAGVSVVVTFFIVSRAFMAKDSGK